MNDKLYLSSIRGVMGDWVYYSAVVPLAEVAARVTFAEELYENPSLGELLQRALKDQRSEEIKDYLLTQEQRFFNSLIAAVYGGEPRWHPIQNISGGDLDLAQVPPEIVESLGILELQGNEVIFALDGQHRLSGIKKAVAHDESLGFDELSVLFIAHDTSKEGRERSRRLFTVLNKHAKKVTKKEVIALDEDDTMAIVLRELLRTNPLFSGRRISPNHTYSIASTNNESLTTLGNMYDLLEILFVEIYPTGADSRPTRRKRLIEKRLPDSELDRYLQVAGEFFDTFVSCFGALEEFRDGVPSEVIPRYRYEEGGSILFRPIGLKIAFSCMAELMTAGGREFPLSIQDIPTDLLNDVYRDVIWDAARNRIIHRQANFRLAVDLLLLLLGKDENREDVASRYSKITSKEFPF